MLILVIRGTVEESLAAVRRRLGPDLAVHAVYAAGPRQTIVHVDAPLGHDVHRWLNEHGDLVWFNMVD